MRQSLLYGCVMMVVCGFAWCAPTLSAADKNAAPATKKQTQETAPKDKSADAKKKEETAAKPAKTEAAKSKEKAAADKAAADKAAAEKEKKDAAAKTTAKKDAAKDSEKKAAEKKTDAQDTAKKEVKDAADKKTADKKDDAKKSKEDEAKKDKEAKKKPWERDTSGLEAFKAIIRKGVKDSTAAVQKPGEKKPEKTEEKALKKALKTATLVTFTLKGDYEEGPSQPGLFAELQPSLGAIVQRLDAAGKDKDVAAVWLKIEDTALGRGKIYELRAAIARLRKAQKLVYAELTTADGGQYLLACACDKIIMPPSGMLIIPGVRAEVNFYKGLLEKLGLQFDALQMGKYKGAAEPYTRREMSKPLRESLEAVVDSTYQNLVTTIAEDRKLLDFQVKSLLDHGLFTAATAQKAGLVDEVAYADQFQDGLKRTLKVDKLNIVAHYKKKRIDTDFSGMTGMMKFMQMMMGAKSTKATGTKPKIAVVYAVGAITEGRSQSDMFGNSSLGSSTVVAALRSAEENPQVAAVVLRIDSPGGSATASDLIWRETVRMKKPVIASMGDVAGSGGYYIAMGAKKIFAAPGTLTGSIGVIGGKMVTRGLYDKIGVDTEVISRGANSGTLSSSQPFTPTERKAWTELLAETYRQFVQKAAAGRKMPYAKLDKLAQGRVYTGAMAKRLGLIDALGTVDDAVKAAKAAAGLKADAEIDILMLPEPKSFFEQVFGDPSASADFDSLLPEYFQLLRQTKILRRLFAEPVLLWMPYEVQVK